MTTIYLKVDVDEDSVFVPAGMSPAEFVVTRCFTERGAAIGGVTSVEVLGAWPDDTREVVR